MQLLTPAAAQNLKQRAALEETRGAKQHPLMQVGGQEPPHLIRWPNSF